MSGKNFTFLEKLDALSLNRKRGLVVAAFALHILAFIFSPLVGAAITSLVFIPILAIAWFFGPRAGVIGSLVGIIINVFLMGAVFHVEFQPVLVRNMLFGSLSLIPTAYLVGMLSEQRILAEALSDVAAALNSTLEINQVLDRILTNIGRVVPHDAANILLIEDAGESRYEASGIARVARSHVYEDFTPMEGSEPLLGLKLSDLPGLQRMVATGQPLIIPDTRQSAVWVSFPVTAWVRSYAGAPIQVKGKTVGFIGLDSASPGFYSKRHSGHLQAFAGQAAIALENARLYTEVQRLAITDGLTGLFNRGYFDADLQRLQDGRQYPVSIVIADVDNLKTVNDTRGHAAGDEILKRAASALKIAFRTADMIARIGGDEFAVLLPLTDAAAVNQAEARLQAAVNELNRLNPEPALRLSTGSSTCPQPCNLMEALREADERMYHRKQTKP